MRQVFAILGLLAVLLVHGTVSSPANAQTPVTWAGNFEETHTDTCTWVIARWSDGTDTRIPGTCVQYKQVQTRPGTSARILAAYYEVEADGCTWLVAHWSDEQYTAVPLDCPAGSVAVKPAAVPFSAIPNIAGQIATVVRVTETGAIDVDIAGRSSRVQLPGVTVQGAADCFGAETAAYLGALLPAGSQILLESASAGPDSGGILPRNVYLPDGSLLNKLILDLGYGRYDAASASDRYRASQEGSELVAKFNRVGLWGVCGA